MLGTQSIKITSEILIRISDIDEFKGLWNGAERYTSGLYAVDDVAEFGENFRALIDPLQKTTITPSVICILHNAIRGENGAAPYKGGSNVLAIRKDEQVIAELGTAEPEDVEPLLQKLVAWMNEELQKRETHPLIAIAVFAAIFLQIGPFENGNQKTLQFLVMLYMLKTGYAYAPFSPLGVVINDKASLYAQALRKNQESLEAGQPDWDEWLRCFLMLLQDQKDVLLGQMTVQQKKELDLPDLSKEILELFDHHEKLQMREIMHWTYGRRATLKLRINELIENGLLIRKGKGRNTWYERV